MKQKRGTYFIDFEKNNYVNEGLKFLKRTFTYDFKK